MRYKSMHWVVCTVTPLIAAQHPTTTTMPDDTNGDSTPVYTLAEGKLCLPHHR